MINNEQASYGAADSTTPESAATQESSAANPAGSFGSSWKLNAVMCLICCWYAMALTGWGAIEKRGDIGRSSCQELCRI